MDIVQAKVKWRGKAVPYVLQWNDQEPDFTALDPEKLYECINEELCALCGFELTLIKVWVGGNSHFEAFAWYGDPPQHPDCALYTITHCPFLRREGKFGANQPLYLTYGQGMATLGLLSRPKKIFYRKKIADLL